MDPFYVSDTIKDESEKESVAAKTTQKPRTRQKTVPPEYIKVSLSSLGKLGTPTNIHVRDYLGEDVFKLSMVEDKRFLDILIDTVDGMIFEDVDAGNLHENELIEIMMNVYANFWSSHITDYPFPITDEDWDKLDEDRKTRLDNGVENLLIDISITDLKTDLIAEDFKEPINFKRDGLDVSFILPRVGHIQVTRDYIQEAFLSESEKFYKVEALLSYNAKLSIDDIDMKKYIDPSTLDEYNKYIDDRLALTNKVKTAQVITAYKGKTLETLEEKIAVYEKLGSKVWTTLNNIIDKHSDFGVDSNVGMISPIDNENVIRRCRFRLLDVIPPAESQGDNKFIVSFG